MLFSVHVEVSLRPGIADPQGARGSSLVLRPFARSNQRPVRDPDSRNLQLGTKVQRQPGSSRMIASGGIHQQYVRATRQGAYGLLQQRAEP